jgi:hypothetical protein
MFLKQGKKIIDKVIESVIPKPKQWWYTHSEMRQNWLSGLRGSFMPHQGAQEKARRVRQLAAGIIRS